MKQNPKYITEDSDKPDIPCAPKCEKQTLGYLMTYQDAYENLSDKLMLEYFYDCKHKYIYETIIELAEKQSVIDLSTVTIALREKNKIDIAGGITYLISLTGEVVTSLQAMRCVKTIEEKYLSREIIKLTSCIQAKAYREEAIYDTIDELEKDVFNLQMGNTKTIPVSIDKLIKDFVSELTNHSKVKDWIPSGFEKIDKYVLGWQKGDFIIIASRPSMGKTGFMTSLVRNISIDNQIPSAIFSLEMTEKQLLKRFVIDKSEIESQKIELQQLEADEWKQIDTVMSAITNAPVYIDCPSSLTIQAFCSKARWLVRKNGVKIIFIDYLQLLTIGKEYSDNRYNEINYITRTLKALAKELEIPIIALSQLNRNPERESKLPRLWDLRDSGTICDDADMVCFIHRPEYYNIYKDEEGHSLKGIAKFIIAKNRNGDTVEVELRFKQQFCKFEDLEENATIFSYYDILPNLEPNNTDSKIITGDDGKVPF